MLGVVGGAIVSPFGPVGGGAVSAFANAVAPPGMDTARPSALREIILRPEAAPSPGFIPTFGIAPAGVPGPTPGPSYRMRSPGTGPRSPEASVWLGAVGEPWAICGIWSGEFCSGEFGGGGVTAGG